MIGDFVRDKDAISACALIAEMTFDITSKDKSLFDKLIELYQKFGFYKERLISFTRKGKSGAQEILNMMEKFRENPPTMINRSKIIKIIDYLKSVSYNTKSGSKRDIDFPISNVLQFITDDGSKISMRPSGTEPKIKFYLSVNTELKIPDDFDQVNSLLDHKMDEIIDELGLNQ